MTCEKCDGKAIEISRHKACDVLRPDKRDGIYVFHDRIYQSPMFEVGYECSNCKDRFYVWEGIREIY